MSIVLVLSKVSWCYRQEISGTGKKMHAAPKSITLYSLPSNPTVPLFPHHSIFEHTSDVKIDLTRCSARLSETKSRLWSCQESPAQRKAALRGISHRIQLLREMLRITKLVKHFSSGASESRYRRLTIAIIYNFLLQVSPLTKAWYQGQILGRFVCCSGYKSCQLQKR